MITQDDLKKILNYDPITGIFTRIHRFKQYPANSVAGYRNKLGYVDIRIFGKQHGAHRLAFLFMSGYMPEKYVDHKNGNPSDNSWDNLREVTNSENQQNRHTPYPNNRTGFLGVRKHRNRYEAGIKVNGKKLYLGTFDTAQEAAEAYNSAKRTLHPYSIKDFL